jgi:hypothetical protein
VHVTSGGFEVAPLVAMLLKFGFSALAGAVASKGPELIQEKLGIDITSMIGTEQGRVKLKEMELAHEQFLVNAAQASEVRDLEYFKTEVEDRASARLRDSEFIKNAKENWRAHLMFVIAVGVVIWLTWLVWKSPDVTEFNKGVITLLLGRFLGYLDNIYNFEFGTTRSSRQKDETIQRMSKEL